MSKGRIIVVDDDKLMQLTIKEILVEFDYDVIAVFSTGEEVVYKAPELLPDLILMDIQLSGYMDGIEAGERIKAVIDIPIIFISGMDDESTIERSRCTDPFGYILKPFKTKELIITVELAIYKYNTQKKLKQNEFFFKSTFISVSEGLISIDNKGVIKLANPYAEKILLKSHDNIIGTKIFDVLITRSNIFEKFLSDSMESNKWKLKYAQPYESEFELIIGSEQTVKAVFLSLNPLYDNNEIIMGYVITVRDLTEQKKTRDLINKLYMAIKQSPIGVMMLSPKGIIEYINPKFEEITQFQYEDIVGKKVDVIHNEKISIEKVNQVWNSLLNDKEQSFEWQNFKKDGTPYWEFISLSPVKNDKGEIIQFISLKEDITEKKEFESKLMYNEKKYKDLFQTTPVAICNFDFNEVSEYLKTLKNISIYDLKEYFETNPQYFDNCINRIKIIDINNFSKKFFEVNTHDNSTEIIKIFFKQNFNFTLNILQHIMLLLDSMNNAEFSFFEKLYIPQNEIISVLLNNNVTKHLHTVWYCRQDFINTKFDDSFTVRPQSGFSLLIVAIDITDKIITEKQLKIQTYHLIERIKEQKALFEINRIISDDNLSSNEALQLIANQLITGFQFPGNTACKITYNQQEYFSTNYKKITNNQSIEKLTAGSSFSKDYRIMTEDFMIDSFNSGSIEILFNIGSIKESIDQNQNIDFHKEEMELLKTVTQIISKYILQLNQSNLIQKKLYYETLISKISSRFLNINNFDNSVNQSLAEIGLASKADRVYIFEYDDSVKTISNTFEWCKDTNSSVQKSLQNIPFNNYPWWKEKILNNEIIYIENVDDMPEKALNEQKLFKEQNIVSLLSLPLTVKIKTADNKSVITKNIGFIGFDDLSDKKPWEQQDITLLKLFSNILSNTYERFNTYKLLQKQKEFSNEVINSVAELIIVIDVDTEEVVIFNQHSEHLSRFSANEIKDLQNFKQLFINEQLDYFTKTFNETKQGKRFNNIELLWRTKDRKFLMINWQFNLIKNSENTPQFVILNGTDITEIKKKEALLKEKETQYRTLIQNLNIGIYRSTGLSTGHFLQANIALAKILGYDTVQELTLNKTKDIFLNQEDRENMLKLAVSNGYIKNYIVQLKKKDYNKDKKNNVILASINAKVINDEKGNFKWLDAFVEDITEIHKNKKALDYQLHFLQNLIDNIPVPLYYVKVNEVNNYEIFEYTISGCNNSFEKFLGISKDKLINKNLKDCISSEMFNIFTKHNDELLIKYKNSAQEKCFTNNDELCEYADHISYNKKSYYFLFHKSVISDNRNDLIGDDSTQNSLRIINSLIDFSELKNTQDTMQKLAFFNKNILSSITNILIAVDNDLKITHWNLQVSKVTKISAENVLGIPIQDIGLEWDIKQILNSFKMVKKTMIEEKITNFLIKSVPVPELFSDNKTSQVNTFYTLTISPIKNSESTDNSINGFLILGEDITEIQSLQNQLYHNQKLEAIGQLAAGIAHEINTPTQFVTDNTQFLMTSYEQIFKYIKEINTLINSIISNKSQIDYNLNKEVDKLISTHEQLFNNIDIDFLSEEIPEATRQSMEGLSNIARIVKAMKDFSHPGVEEMTYSNINNLLESTVTVARNEWKYFADLKLDLEDDLPTILCHPSEFNQAILNVIINATHAIKEKFKDNTKGLITIKTHHDSKFIHIEISDNGIGIPEKIINRIFEPFFTTKEIGKGTGQGLSIVHQIIVEKLKGQLLVSSQERIGTTFKFLLPIH